MEHKSEIPRITISDYLENHNHTTDPVEAHPIEEDIVAQVCDTKMGPILLHYDLAAFQAIALSEIHPYDGETERWVTRFPQDSEIDLFEPEVDRGRPGPMHYYQAQSVTFYDMASVAQSRYNHRIEIDDISDIAEAHTRQYLRDMHGYNGDFGGQRVEDTYNPTLCSAQNDDHSLRDVEPDNAHYAFTDARGLLIEEGTHDE